MGAGIWVAVEKHYAWETGSEHSAETGQFPPATPRGPFRVTEGGTTPGLTSVASFVDHEHIGADANYPTDITL